MAPKRLGVDAILGNAQKIRDLRAQIERLVGFDAPGNPRVPTVLLEGETGTGKGLVARVIHDSGPRAGAPFVDVNCAAIPEAMLEAELFGFEAGAFTDAKRAKPGLFESASGGTLFLDEIDSMSPAVQGKLLKAIEEKSVRRLGSVNPASVDVKLIAATQKDLRIEAAGGTFRADLFHRLAVLVLSLPALREREDDAILLAERFLSDFAAAHRIEPKHLTASASEWLRRHPWPGNVRELGHLMERVTLLCTERQLSNETLRGLAIESPVAAAKPAVAAPTPAAGSFDAADDEAERIRTALARTGGNVLRAARLLGLGRNALRYRMRRLGIDRDDGDEPGNETIRQPPTAAASPPVVERPVAMKDPAWEPKPVAVLAMALSFPNITAAGGSEYEPWTASRRWERAIVERIEGFGGVLLQSSPSRLTAVFGVPLAIEQASLRAVQAILAVRRAAAHAEAPAPELRSAVHAGEVRVDMHSDDPVASVLPIGDVFSLPERLLGHAGPGEILVTAAVARRVERTCELKERVAQLGPHESDRLKVHRVEGPRAASSSVGMSEAGTTAIVGRDRELSVLQDAFALAEAGHGQVVFLAGDAGIGKSRLLSEFRRHLGEQRPHRWVEGRCASYGTRTPFLPIIDGLRRYLAIDDTDDEASATAKISREVERLGPDLSWTLPLVQQVLSLRVGDDSVRGLDSASRRSEIFRALRALTLRAAELDPVVLVTEDLHWIDPASEEYLSFVGDAVPAARVLVVLSHRPGYTHSFPDRSYHQRIMLAPLSRRDSATMTGSILGTTDVPPQLHSLIAEKAEGNPFFVEELTRSLLEDGVLRRENGGFVLARALEEISVPETIQDVLIARIDRLADESKHAIQVASVIGREFALRLLERITEAGDRIHTQVEELRALELVYEKALHPELAYMFKHALTHDVAYESVLRERRKSLHRTIGLAIEELYRERLGEHYETLAHHFGRAEEWLKALDYHERSAEKAGDTHANRAVVEHCRQALEIAALLGERAPAEQRRRIYERLGRAYFYLSEYGESGIAFENAARHAAAREGQSFFLAEAALSHFWAHGYEASRRCIEAALEIARHGDAPGGEAMAIGVQGFQHGVLEGDVVALESSLRRGLEICSRHPHEEAEAFALHELAMVCEWTGDYAGAADFAARAMVIGRRLRRADMIILPTWFLGKARCCLGDYGGAVTLLEGAHDLCTRIGDRAWRSRLLNTLGWCFAELGWAERARDYNEQAAALARQIGDPEILSNASINLAMNHIALGEPSRSLEHLEPIEAALERPGDPWMRWRYALHVRQTRALVELARGEPGKAFAAAGEELEGARLHRAPKIETRALVAQGRSLLAMDQREEAAHAFDTAREIAERLGYRRGVWQAYRSLAACARRSGDENRADEFSARAKRIASEAARTLSDDDLRRRVLASVDSTSD